MESAFFPSKMGVAMMKTNCSFRKRRSPQRKVHWPMTWMILSSTMIIMTFGANLIESLAFGAKAAQKNQLDIAFVTGNEMKVRELLKILAKEGAIDEENPDNSLGEYVSGLSLNPHKQRMMHLKLLCKIVSF